MRQKLELGVILLVGLIPIFMMIKAGPTFGLFEPMPVCFLPCGVLGLMVFGFVVYVIQNQEV